MAHVDLRHTMARSSRAADNFCWSCRRDAPKPTMHCTSCVRSYHVVFTCCGSKCLSEDELRTWKCPVCVAIEKDEQKMQTEQYDAQHVNKLLDLVFDHIKSDEYLTNALMTIDYSKVNQKVAKRIDLSTIEQNITDLRYQCYDEFLSDIKWIVHNVKVYYQTIFYGEEEALKVVKWLLDMTKEAIYSIRMCHECYLGLAESQRFDMVCKQPHLVVWAKQKTYPYWPAKLMSVNATTNTVEVRYFGGKHCRAILSSKECYMYTKLIDRPSLWLGAHKTEFKEAHEAIAEADLYIKQLIKVYGTFNLAATNTPLNASMLERHLFDTMPKAWISLGKTAIPPPIPKTFAGAAATIARRHSIASRPSLPTTPPPLATDFINSDRIAMRRVHNELNQGAESTSGMITRNIITRRQSIQVDMFNTPSTSVSRVGIVSPLLNTPKKRKIDDEQLNSKADNFKNSINASTSKSSDDLVFKVPEVPRKLRKLQPKIDPAIMANVEAINKMASPPPSNKHSSASIRSNTADVSAPKKLCTKTVDRNKNKAKVNLDTKFNETALVPFTEMGALFNAVIEKNTRKVTECIRSSLTDMLNEFWDSTKPEQQLQKLQDQLDSMRTDYSGQVNELQNENHTLKQNLDALNDKYEVQLAKVRQTMSENVELNEILCATKSKMAVMSQDLKKSIASNTRVSAKFDKMSKQNGEWQSKIRELKAQHGNTLKTLKDVESKMEALNETNKSLVAKNTGLNVSMQRVTKQYQNLSNQMQDMESKCNKEKTSAYEQCYQMISDNKKKQWCVVCQKQGGRYYCSSDCEEYFWKQNRP